MDIEKLKKERPELFDYADIPDGTADPTHLAAMKRLAPGRTKDLSDQKKDG